MFSLYHVLEEIEEIWGGKKPKTQTKKSNIKPIKVKHY